jgi:serine phosphatase RsbU (regulator of sigma subunit)
MIEAIIRPKRNNQGKNSMIMDTKSSVKKHFIDEEQRQMTESIVYAQRLQNAMLPSTEEINSFVKDHFILNLPKSIVSGDFYLVDSFATIRGRQTAIALADCTGHGVPGAILSTLCCGILKNALADTNICLAGEVLDDLRTKVATVFRECCVQGKIRDGMDLSLCIIDPKTNILQYAGANQKGLILRKNNEIVELLPNKQHIGYNEHYTTFTTNFIQLQQGDTIYLFSDGFRDQFGGEAGKKLLYKNFVNKLIETSDHALEEQKKLIEKFFNEWKKDIAQTDDVLVMGIRI